MDTRYFSDKVVKWYQLNKRDLPWRETADPYKVWLSEIILQQTRVNQGLPYYLKFVEKFSTVRALADASEQQVLRLWQGLGYYSRARNLHRCAKDVVRWHGSSFPGSFESLKKLPGIGDYTAAAIASICFKERVAVVDGNVFRLLSRIFGIEQETNSTAGKKIFSALANKLMGRHSPAVHNQAVMEFGALYCTPKSPDCSQCIFRSDCFANRHSLQRVLPVKTKPKATRKRYFYYLVVQKGKSLMMKKRVESDIWHGLYDFFLVEKSRPTGIDNILGELSATHGLQIKIDDILVSLRYKHTLTHQVIFTKFIVIPAAGLNHLVRESLSFYTPKKIMELPKPVLVSRFLADYQLL